MSRSKNDRAGALAKLASSLTLSNEREIQITIGKQHLLASILDPFDEKKKKEMWSQFFRSKKNKIGDNLLLNIFSMASNPLIQSEK